MNKKLLNDQRALTDQLKDLVVLANKAGLYDAANYLKSLLQKDDKVVDSLISRYKKSLKELAK